MSWLDSVNKKDERNDRKDIGYTYLAVLQMKEQKEQGQRMLRKCGLRIMH